MKPAKVVILSGPTASGKSALALELAEASGQIEIINADSILVYRGMDIGSAKPTAAEMRRVPHHLIDIRDPHEEFNAADFVRSARAAIEDIQGRGRRALICGGTAFYLKALLYGLWEAPGKDAGFRETQKTRSNEDLYAELRRKDPASLEKINANDRYRLIRALEILHLTGRRPSEIEKAHASQAPDPRFELWAIDRPQDEMERRIEARTQWMLDHGIIEETERIRSRYAGARALQSVGYAQVIDHLDGNRPEGRRIAEGLEGLCDEINLATRQLVKRQRTFLRGESLTRWFTLDRDLDTLRDRFREIYA